MSERDTRIIPAGPPPASGPETGPGPAAPPAGAPAGHEPPPAGAGFMNALRWALFAGLLLLAAVSIGSYVFSKRPAANAAQNQKKALYHCPMHPSYTSDKPGECPICGMNLEPITESEHHAQLGHAGDVPGLQPVQITPERIQLIGVRTAVVTRAQLGAELDLVGFVVPDESRIRRVQIRVAG